MNEKQYEFYVQLFPLAVSEVFQKNNVMFTRKLRLDALKDIVESKTHEEVKRLKQKKVDSSETFSPKDQHKLLRLEQFAHLSEVQLENELESYHDSSLFQNYYKLLWSKIIKSLKETKNGSVIDDLNKLKSSETISHTSVISYNKVFDDYFVDVEQEIDGLSVQMMRKFYPITTNRKELKRLADKFNILIPTNTSKSFLQTKLLQVLKDTSRLSDELINKINNGTLKSLKLIMSELDISAQDLLTIPEIIEIIIEKAKNKQIKVDAVVSANQQLPVDQSSSLNSSLLEQILLNQKLILQNLEIFNEGKNEAKKKKTVDVIFNVVVIILIILVVIVWMVYAVTTLFA